jgi:hypothetical protein
LTAGRPIGTRRAAPRHAGEQARGILHDLVGEDLDAAPGEQQVGRDVKAVHADVHALLDAGILEKTGDGRIVFPYDAVRVSFVLQAA